MDPLFVKAEEAATVLRIGRSRTFELLKSGELASVKVGRSRLIPVQAIEDYARRLLAGNTAA